jgi:hypothetical protein
VEVVESWFNQENQESWFFWKSWFEPGILVEVVESWFNQENQESWLILVQPGKPGILVNPGSTRNNQESWFQPGITRNPGFFSKSWFQPKCFFFPTFFAPSWGIRVGAKFSKHRKVGAFELGQIFKSWGIVFRIFASENSQSILTPL